MISETCFCTNNTTKYNNDNKISSLRIAARITEGEYFLSPESRARVKKNAEESSPPPKTLARSIIGTLDLSTSSRLRT